MNYTLHLPENYVKPPLPGRDEWIRELRSGNHLQGTGQLCAENKKCCLGVLSNLQGRLEFLDDEWRDGGWNREGLEEDNPTYVYLGSLGRFPKGVTVQPEDMSHYHGLAHLNDRGFTFDQIATIIEAVWDHAPKNW